MSWKFCPGSTSYNSLASHDRWYNADPSSTLYKNGVATTQVGQFEYDAIQGNLPTVSWIFPDSHDVSEHPTALPAAGANFIAAKLNAIAANRELWESTVFIVNYDENDGLGYRVPMIIVSPWTQGGRVCSDASDHTSALKFLEVITGSRRPTSAPGGARGSAT